MQILNAQVNWHIGYANAPTLEVFIDELPPAESFVYDEIQTPDGRSNLYKAVGPGGVVEFFAHSGKDENNGGFGGREFTLRMRDGSTKVLKGPWSSRASVMNEFFPGEHCTEVTFITQHGYRFAGALQITEARRAAAMAGVTLTNGDHAYLGDGEVSYDILEPKPEIA